MASTLHPVPGPRRSPWKVVVAIVLLSLATLLGIFWLVVESMGVIMAYAPTEVPVRPAARLKDARHALGLKDDEYKRWIHLADVAHWTVDTGDRAGAVALADEALAMAPKYARDWNYGNVIHTANLTRGRVALRCWLPGSAKQCSNTSSLSGAFGRGTATRAGRGSA